MAITRVTIHGPTVPHSTARVSSPSIRSMAPSRNLRYGEETPMSVHGSPHLPAAQPSDNSSSGEERPMSVNGSPHLPADPPSDNSSSEEEMLGSDEEFFGSPRNPQDLVINLHPPPPPRPPLPTFPTVLDLDDDRADNIFGATICRFCGNMRWEKICIPERFDYISQYFLTHKKSMKGKVGGWFLHNTSNFRPCRDCGSAFAMKPFVPAKIHQQIHWLFLFFHMSLNLPSELQLLDFAEAHEIDHVSHQGTARLLYKIYVKILKYLNPEGNY